MADYTQHLAFDELADGSLIARLTLRFPNGAERRFAVPFTAADGARAAAEIAEREGGEVSTVVAGLVGKLADDPAHWYWREAQAKRERKSAADEVALQAWWKKLGRGTRATIKAMHAEGPPGSVAVKEAWFRGLSKNRRDVVRDRHGGDGDGFVGDVVKVVKDVDRALDKSVLGKAAQVLLPALAVGRWSFKNPEKAVSFIPGGSSAVTALKTGVKLMPAAKKLAAGKVMEAAAQSLDAAGSTPMGAGAAKALKMTAELNFANAAKSLGADKAAAAFAQSARRVVEGVSPGVADAAFQLARTTSANIEKLATGATGAKPSGELAKVLAAAKAGKVKSNRKGPVTAAELERALKDGRVFFLRAS